MAIITLVETKEILQITTSDYDTLITALIPEAEGHYLTIRGIDWFEIEADITSGSAIINNICDKDIRKVDPGAYFEADGIQVSSRVLQVNKWKSGRVSITENNIVIDKDATATTENLLIRIYPKGSKTAAAKIIDYFLDTNSSNGYQSERTGTHSWTKFENNTGIPKDIARLIKPYQSVKK